MKSTAGRFDALIIARTGKPVARLVPFRARAIRLGLAAGKYAIPTPDSPELQEIERRVAAEFDVHVQTTLGGL